MTLTKNFAAKLAKTITAVMLIASTFVACKKENTSLTPAQVEGEYMGKQGLGDDIPDFDFKFKVEANGVFQELNPSSGIVTCEGTWVINGNELTATFTMVTSPFNTYSIKGTYDNGHLTGTWGFDGSYTDGGKIDVTKQ